MKGFSGENRQSVIPQGAREFLYFDMEVKVQYGVGGWGRHCA